MTLRTRLVLALLALATVGLAVFGMSTYTLYRRSLQQQLDQDLRALARGQGGRLLATAGQSAYDLATCQPTGSSTPDPSTPGGSSFPASDPGGAPGQGLDAYSELRGADGSPVACILPLGSTARPDLPGTISLGSSGEQFLETGSASGSGSWRVLAVSSAQLPGPGPGFNGADPRTSAQTVVVALRTKGMEASLARLARIELLAALCLLAALGGGAWVILRRGLRPLEEMAASAERITAGDLTERVDHADDRTEVGQLGLALNTMLDGIEQSFAERDATEARLRQFLADASHELRTPLTSIQGYAELFRMADTGDPADLERIDLPVVLDRIEQASGRMRGLIEALLLRARIAEPRALGLARVDLSLVAAEACSSAAAVDPDGRITLHAPQPVPVAGVAEHLHRAVLNLVANAVKHTPADSPIEVTVAANAVTRIASVTVRDHGPGLDPEALEHVFDRFWQADAARVGAGSGLGLSIVAGIAAEHGGRATVANAPDGGAAFAVELPLSGR